MAARRCSACGWRTGDHKPGHVDVLRDGLMMGYTDHFSTVDINVDIWVELCRKAAVLWDEMTGVVVE